MLIFEVCLFSVCVYFRGNTVSKLTDFASIKNVKFISTFGEPNKWEKLFDFVETKYSLIFRNFDDFDNLTDLYRLIRIANEIDTPGKLVAVCIDTSEKLVAT